MEIPRCARGDNNGAEQGPRQLPRIRGAIAPRYEVASRISHIILRSIFPPETIATIGPGPAFPVSAAASGSAPAPSLMTRAFSAISRIACLVCSSVTTIQPSATGCIRCHIRGKTLCPPAPSTKDRSHSGKAWADPAANERANGAAVSGSAAQILTSGFSALIALPTPVMSRLCPELNAREKLLFDGVRYHGIVCLSVLLSKSLSPYYVTNITDAGYPFTAVIEMTSLVDKAELGGNALIYLPRYVAPNDELFDRTDAEIEHEFLSGLQRMHPGLSLADVRAVRISRVRHVFALPTLGYSDRLPPVVTSVPGLYSLNSSHIVNGTLNVNETIKLANDFVARLPLLRHPRSSRPPGRTTVDQIPMTSVH